MQYELSISKAASLLDVSESRISQLIAQGALDSVTVNGRRRISQASLLDYKNRPRKPGRPRNATNDFILMNGPYEVMLVRYDKTSDLPWTAAEIIDATRCPWGTVTAGGKGKKRELNAWWRSRSIPNARPHIDSKLIEFELAETYELPFRNYGLSLSDCYWIKQVDDTSGISWRNINYFENDFDNKQSDSWDFWLSNIGLDSPDNTSEGALPKKWIVKNGKRILLKGCRTDDQRPFNEVVATNLHARLMRPEEYVPYETTTTADGVACACQNFLGKHEEYIPASSIMETMGATRGASLYDRLCRYVGKLGINEFLFREHMEKMIVSDAIIANSDRHRRNFGLIRNIDTLEMRIAPVFDSGNCLWYEKSEKSVEQMDWSYAAKPFGPQPEKQLSLIHDTRWFSPESLEGFADKTAEILSESSYATAPRRLDFIIKGIERQIDFVSRLLAVVAFS